MARHPRCHVGLLIVGAWIAACDSSPPRIGGSALPHREFRTADGVRVPDREGVSEGYAVTTAAEGFSVFTVNVSADRLSAVFRELSALIGGPGFFLLETGTHRDVEEKLRTRASDPFHKDVYYLDGITTERAQGIVTANERNLIHDGGVNFGFGAHEGHDEVFVGPYKIVTIYADAPQKYRATLGRLGFAERETLRTVRDNFGETTPGQRMILQDARPTRWEMIEALKAQGLHFAERRQD